MLFQNKKLSAERVKLYGFTQEADTFFYQTNLLNGQFCMKVRIAADGAVSSQVIDLASGEPYVLHLVSEAKGAFVGRVREAYEAVLMDISNACFVPDMFKSERTKEVIAYVRAKYQDELEFLWKRTPSNGIWRRKDTGKWYGALLTVSKGKICMDGDGDAEILDLRVNPEEIAALVDNINYLPGYHMNKKHWFTICMDGRVPLEEIKRRIDASYYLATK